MVKTALKVLIISESGVSAETAKALEAVVATFPKLIAITGRDCRSLEDVCDEFCERTEEGWNIVTTSHVGESLLDVQDFVASFDEKESGREFLTLKI